MEDVFNKPKALCWDCANATGNCPWSAELKPFEGQKFLYTQSGKTVRRCPKFERDSYEGGLYKPERYERVQEGRERKKR